MEEIIRLAKRTLHLLNYTLVENDEILIETLVEKVINQVKIICNISNIPENMYYIISDLVIGEFLQGKKTFSSDDLSNLNLKSTGIIASITIGDTSTSYSNGNVKTDEEQLDDYIKYLFDRKRELVRFRRII